MPDPILNALDLITMDGLDRPSYIEDLDEVLLRNQERALQELHDLHGTIGPDPNYDEEGNIIPHELWAPDLSFAPLISPKNISAGLKNLWQKSSRAMNKPFTQALKDYPVHIGNILVSPGKRIAKTVRKVQDEVAKELGSKTGFKRYLNTLLEQNEQITPSTNLPANRLRKDLISRLGEDKNLYQAYKNTVIDNINRAEYKVALPLDPSKERMAVGMNFRGLFTGPWYSPGYHTPSVFEKPLSALMRKSTKVHEYTHAAQVGRKIPERTLKEDAWNKPFTSVTGQIREDLFRAAGPKGSSIITETLHNEERSRILAGFQQLIDKNIKPDVMEKIDIYRGIKKGPKVSEKGVRIGSHENYLRSWQEVTARIGEMRHAEKLGKNYKQTWAYENLRRLFDDKFITKLKTDYWAVAPIGIGMEAMDDEMYEDLK